MQTTGINWAQMGQVVTVLLLFGTFYALIVRAAARKQMMEAYTFVFVIFGTLVTVLMASFLIGPQNTIYVLICFAASGLPISIENMIRHEQDRRSDIEASRNAAKDTLRDGK